MYKTSRNCITSYPLWVTTQVRTFTIVTDKPSPLPPQPVDNTGYGGKQPKQPPPPPQRGPGNCK